MGLLNRTTTVPLGDSQVDTFVLGVNDISELVNAVTFSFGTPSKKVAGIEKLAGIFLKKLFTVRGSNPLDIYEGTEFATLVGSNIGDEENAIVITQSAIEDAVEQIKEEQVNQTLPDDEVLSSAKLLNFVFTSGDRIDVYIDLLSVAGSRATIKAPTVEL
jgi:hypothetical protein